MKLVSCFDLVCIKVWQKNAMLNLKVLKLYWLRDWGHYCPSGFCTATKY